VRREKALVHSGRQTRPGHLLITKAEKADLQDQLEILLKDEPEKGESRLLR